MSVPIVLIAGFFACTDPPPDEVDTVPSPASIRGRLCPFEATDALIYTNVYDDEGRIVDVRKAYPDAEYRWKLVDLPPEREYTVYVQQRNETLSATALFVGDGQNLSLPDPDCFDTAAVRTLVVTGDYDNVEAVLPALGMGDYDLVDGLDDEAVFAALSDSTYLAQFDVLVFNSGCHEAGLFYTDNPDNTIPDLLRSKVGRFVREGGAVFASELAYDVVESIWPDSLDFVGDDLTPNVAELGEYDSVVADVSDALSTELGQSTARIAYDRPRWPPITNAEPFVTVQLTGSVRYVDDRVRHDLAAVPLLVTFSDGDGRVGFSTFRVAANQGDEMMPILDSVFTELAAR